MQKLSLGENALIYIPYALGYKETGSDPIPPCADLVFDIDVLEMDGMSSSSGCRSRSHDASSNSCDINLNVENRRQRRRGVM